MRVRGAQLDAETNQLRAALFSSVTHDLRTPLASIKASVTSLLSEAAVHDAAQQRELLTTVLEETDRLNRVVGNLMDLAKIRAGALEPAREPAAVDELVQTVVARLRPQLANVQLRFAIRSDLPDVFVDPVQIDQVLTNLLENAALHSPAGGEVTISAAPFRDVIQVRVADRGSGIADGGARAGVRGVLSRGRGAGTTRERARARHRARGRRRARREDLGGGRAGRGNRRGVRAAGLGGGAVTTVLVVDDEPQIRRALRTSLEAHGYDVATVGTGEEGILHVADTAPDLVLLDLGLPDIDGTEVVRRVRAFSEVPVIVLSVRDGSQDKVAALDAGADDYVTKPFAMEELLARARATLRRRGGTDPSPPLLTFGPLEVDLARRLVTRGTETVHLTPTEYALLEALATNPGKLLTHQWLLRKVWGQGYGSETTYLRTYVRALRKKLGDDASAPALILTEPGVGYRWVAEPST